MRLYRLMHKAHLKNIPILPGLLLRLIRIIYSCDLALGCEFGQGVVLKHNGLGVVVHPKVKVGENTLIYQNVTLGGRSGRGAPIVGKNVFIGAGACILGGIKIGDNAQIGANAVVLKDVEAGTTVVGIPAKVIKKNK